MLHLLFSTVKGFRTFWAVGFKPKDACFDAYGCILASDSLPFNSHKSHTVVDLSVSAAGTMSGLKLLDQCNNRSAPGLSGFDHH